MKAAASKAAAPAPKAPAKKKVEEETEGIVIPIGAGSVAKGIVLPPLPWMKKKKD